MKQSEANKQVQRTREWIFGALMILLETESYNRIKIGDITEKAGVARQTYYRNYDSKDDIIITYLQGMFDEFRDQLESIHLDDYKKMYTWVFEVFLEHREALVKIKNAGLEDLLFTQIASHNRFFFKYMMRGKKQQNYEDAFRNELFINYQMGGITRVIMEWIKKDMRPTPKEMGQVVHEITSMFENKEGYIPRLLEEMDK